MFWHFCFHSASHRMVEQEQDRQLAETSWVILLGALLAAVLEQVELLLPVGVPLQSKGILQVPGINLE